MEFIRFMFSGDFWQLIICFIIFSIMIYAPIRLLEYLWMVYWRSKTILKHGYPPEHCDVYGNSKKLKKSSPKS